MTYTDYLKQKFIKTGECIKDNFEEKYPTWREELDDSELDEFANEWRNKELKKWVELTDKAIQELQTIKSLVE